MAGYETALVIKLVEAGVTYGVPAITSLIASWDAPPTIEECDEILKNLPKASDAFPDSIYGTEDD